jgi:hypothetical protein
MTMNNSASSPSAVVTYQTTRHVQARHLKQFETAHRSIHHQAITVRIDGTWREVFDIWQSGDDPAEIPVADDAVTARIADAIDYASPCWVVVRYVVEERCTPAEIADGLCTLRTCDLVEVQVPDPRHLPA